MTTIYCFNNSTVFKSSDMFLMINALNMMLPAFCRTWGLKMHSCIAAPANVKTSNIKPGAMYCAFLDNSDAPDALAYHTEFGNVPYGTVFVKTILNYGGTTFINGKRPSISQAFSHEIFEMIVNQNINVWWQQPNGLLVPAEVCDPVQGNIIPVKVGSVTVGISDYIFPEWNDPQSTKGPYNFLGTLTRPFQMAKGGYLIVMRNGIISNVFADSVTPYVQYRAENVLDYFGKHSCDVFKVVKAEPVEPVAPVVVAAVVEVAVESVIEVAVEPVVPVTVEPVVPVTVEPVVPVTVEPVVPVVVVDPVVAEPVAEPVTEPVTERVAEPVVVVDPVRSLPL